MKLIIDIGEEWYSHIIASKDHIDEDDEAYLILNGTPEETHEEKPQKEDYGQWIKHKDYHDSIKYGCNQCGNLTNIPSNFCPNCGKRMKKGARNVKE